MDPRNATPGISAFGFPSHDGEQTPEADPTAPARNLARQLAAYHNTLLEEKVEEGAALIFTIIHQSALMLPGIIDASRRSRAQTQNITGDPQLKERVSQMLDNIEASLQEMDLENQEEQGPEPAEA